jgi:hypothetical protein
MLSDFANFVQLTVPVYSVLALVFGYFVISLLSNWRTRASFSLTLLLVSVAFHSVIGLTLTAIPALISVLFFEIECHKLRSGTAYSEARNARFKNFPIEKWDGGTPLVVFDTEIFLIGDKAFEYISKFQGRKNLQICKCGPVYMQEVDDHIVLDGLSFNAVLPAEVKETLDALNIAIRKADAVSWEQIAVAIDIHDLQERTRLWQRSREDASP